MIRRLALAAVALLSLAQARPARAQSGDPPPEPPTPTSTPDPSSIPSPPPPPPEPDPAAAAAAAALQKRQVADLVDVFEDGNRVPQNPALDILDANNVNAVKPGNIKDLGTDLRALYAGGKVVPQIAVELVPYDLALGHRTSYDDYRRKAWVPLVHRLSVSVATTSITDGAVQATLGAVGLRMRLIDRSDWRLDKAAVGCAMAATTLAKPPAQPGGGTVVPVPAEDEATKAEALKIQQCFEQAKQRTGWNATQLAVGGAISSSFPEGKLRADIRDLTGWIGYAHRLGRTNLVTVAGKYLFADTRKDGDLRIPARHSGSIAGEIEHRGQRYGILGSVGVGRRWSDDRATMTWTKAWVTQLGGGVQLRVTDATWVELRLSAQIVEDGDGAVVSLANFKWNFDVKPAKVMRP